jgi:hypothetical protein
LRKHIRTGGNALTKLQSVPHDSIHRSSVEQIQMQDNRELPSPGTRAKLTPYSSKLEPSRKSRERQKVDFLAGGIVGPPPGLSLATPNPQFEHGQSLVSSKSNCELLKRTRPGKWTIFCCDWSTSINKIFLSQVQKLSWAPFSRFEWTCDRILNVNWFSQIIVSSITVQPLYSSHLIHILRCRTIGGSRESFCPMNSRCMGRSDIYVCYV